MIRTIWTHLDICRKCPGQSKLFPIYFSNWEGKGDASRAKKNKKIKIKIIIKKNHSILRFLSLVRWTLFCMGGKGSLRLCHMKSDVINYDQHWSLQQLPITTGGPGNCRCYSHCILEIMTQTDEIPNTSSFSTDSATFGLIPLFMVSLVHVLSYMKRLKTGIKEKRHP